jgi:hypothetical protein
LNIVLLTEWNPKLGKLCGFHKRVEGERRAAIIGYIASKLVCWVINCQQREHGVYGDDRRFKHRICSCHKYVH